MGKQTETRSSTETGQTGISAMVGKDTLPWLIKPVSVPIEHINHGSSMIVGWAMGTHPVFDDIFLSLRPNEQDRIKEQVRKEAEKISIDGISKTAGVLSAHSKPDVFRLPVGHPNDPNKLNAFYIRGKWMGRSSVYCFAGGNESDAKKLERLLGTDYKASKRAKTGGGVRR